MPPPHEASLEQVSQVSEMLRVFMEEHEAATEKMSKAQEGTERDVLRSNEVSVQALDHALQSMGLSLKQFQWQGSQARPLAAGETRYGLAEDVWPEGFRLVKRRRRSCILEASGSKRIEVPKLASAPKQLHIVLDRGPCSWPSLFWLYGHLGLDGTFWADPNHLVWTSTQAALKESGYWCTFVEISLLCSVKTGPWEGCAFLSVLREASEEYFTLVPEGSDELMRFFEAPLSVELGVASPGRLGSEDGFRHLRRKVQDRLEGMRQGSRVKLARWFSYFDCAAELEKEWSLHLFILLYIGLRSGWWASLAETPLMKRVDIGSEQAPAMEEQSACVASSSAQPPRTVKGSNEELKKLRAACKNQLHVVAHLLCSMGTRSMMKMLNIATAPIREDFGLMTTKHKTRKGGMDWLWDMCRGGSCDLLRKIFATLHDPKVTAFLFYSEAVDSQGSEASDRDQVFLCERYLDLVRCLAKQRLLFASLYEEALPAKLALLVSPFGSDVESVLSELSSIFDALCSLERQSLTDPFAKGILDDLAWPANPFVRHVLIALWDCEFAFVPPDVARQVEGMC